MFAKARRDERGLLAEPSVVQTPAARTIAGLPNSAFGLAYYPLVSLGALAGLWINAARVATLAGATLAALFSVYLAYSLLFVTRRACPFCWTGHLANWIIWAACLHMLLFCPNN